MAMGTMRAISQKHLNVDQKIIFILCVHTYYNTLIYGKIARMSFRAWRLSLNTVMGHFKTFDLNSKSI